MFATFSYHSATFNFYSLAPFSFNNSVSILAFFFCRKFNFSISKVFWIDFVLHRSQESDGEKSDDNLVVDVSNEVLKSFPQSHFLSYLVGKNESWFLRLICAHPSQDPASPRGSPAHSPRENGLDKSRLLKKDAPLSPSSIASSSSTPSSKSKEINLVSQTSNLSLLILLFTCYLGCFLLSGVQKSAKFTIYKVILKHK